MKEKERERDAMKKFVKRRQGGLMERVRAAEIKISHTT